MRKNTLVNLLLPVLIVLVGLSSTCSPRREVGTISTQAAQTVIARLTQEAPPSPTAMPPSPSATPEARLAPSYLPTDTAQPPTETSAPLATDTPQPSETPAPTAAAPAGTSAVSLAGSGITIALIHPGTNGPVACGDSLILSYTGKSRSGQVDKDVHSALDALFGLHGKKVGDFYNALGGSRIRVDSVSFAPDTGTVSIQLSGTYVRAGGNCDSSRARAQVWTTIRQFPEVKVVDIWLNDKLLGDVLSTDN